MKKSFIATEALCLLLGWLGVHRYYTGYIGLGVLQTLTFGGCGIWALIDLIFISIGQYKDSKGQELEGYNKNIGIGALILMAVSALIFGHMRGQETTINKNNITTTNNYATPAPKATTSSLKEKTVKFENATCTVTLDKYGTGHMCFGNLTEADEAQLKKIEEELKN